MQQVDAWTSDLVAENLTILTESSGLGQVVALNGYCP